MNKEVLPSLLGTSVDPNEVEGVVVRRVFAGGDQSFASLVVPGEQVSRATMSCTCTLYMYMYTYIHVHVQ